MSLTQKVFEKWDRDSLTSKYEWKNQLDLFFEDSEHSECEHRNKIMRLLMEDPVSSQWMERSDKQQSKKSDLSIYTIRSTVMREARMIYRHYRNKHPEDRDRAALVYAYWREKHFEYDYEDILGTLAAKQSLINRFYRLNVTDLVG